MKEALLKRHYDSITKQKVISFTKDSNKKNSTVGEEKNKPFGEMLSCCDNPTLNLGYIMKWLVTKKPYSICSEDGKVNKANRKILVSQQAKVFESCGSNKISSYMHNYQYCRCYEGCSNYYDKRYKSSVIFNLGKESICAH